ncbi:hypothetical protein ACKQTC_08205 [Peptococcus simiae]|uniref:Uncharacterized protein n=1 Tax=Peptococcus simiae TaxID=1643805 RepID=A0ABW9H1G8_9FIRM
MGKLASDQPSCCPLSFRKVGESCHTSLGALLKEGARQINRSDDEKAPALRETGRHGGEDAATACD